MSSITKKSFNKSFGNGIYEKLSDEDLIKEIKNGSSDAEEYLFYRYMTIIRKIVSSFYIVGAEKDDLQQEALLGMYKAITEYDQDKNCSFKSYACVCIKRHIITVIRNSTRQKHNPLNNYISFNMFANEEKEEYLLEKITNDAVDDPEKIVVSKEREKIISNTVDKYLSKFEKKVLSCYFLGLSYNESSEALNTDPKSIDNALQRIKRKIKNELITRYFY